MTDRNKNGAWLLDVVAEYVGNLEKYLLAHRERRFVEGNKFADGAARAVKLLRHEFGVDGRKAILTLLDHSDIGICCNVASDSIDFATGRATMVLEEIERTGIPFVSMEAHYCLKEWRAGRKQMPGGLVTLEAEENYD